jgi:SMI1 / KNR4 family (SUKH-1)
MTQAAWRPFLERFSEEVLADRRERPSLPSDVVASGWLGYPPATNTEVEDLEKRLGAMLPESYRSFLLTTNGWRTAGAFVYDLLPAAKVTWFRDSHQDWIDAWMEGAATNGESITVSDEEYFVYGAEQNSNFRDAHWRATLAISGIGDSAIYLLNPMVVTANGEREAWCFGSWFPGARRHRTFWDLMQHERQSFVELRDLNESRYFPEDGVETLRPKLAGLVKQLAEKAQSHRRGQQQRASRGRSAGEEYTEGIIAALNDAESGAKMVELQQLSSDALLGVLTDLAADLEHQWKANVRPNSCGVDERDGRAEGNREAAGIIRWFLNQPQS